MADTISRRIWPELLPELAERIAKAAHGNDVACNLRLVNKGAAALLRGPQFTTIRLSQPVPDHALKHKWASPGSMRHLSLKQRQKVLCLMAATGSVSHLEVAVASAGCRPSSAVLQAAAKAGKIDVCKWLLDYGCLRDGALREAAAGGHRDVCELLLADNHIWDEDEGSYNYFSNRYAHAAAAWNGHIDIAEWLMADYPGYFTPGPRPSRDLGCIIGGIAAGCDLPTLQRLRAQLVGLRPLNAPRSPLPPPAAARVVASAAASSTPDWQAKVEWLEAQGYPRDTSPFPSTFTMLAGFPGAPLDRLVWLQQWGYPVDDRALMEAAENGNAEVVEYLLSEGVRPQDTQREREAITAAAEGGHLRVLQAFHRHGFTIAPHVVELGAGEWDFGAIQWLAEVCGGTEDYVFAQAGAKTGSVEVLEWLHERGCPWDEYAFSDAAKAGSEVALEWLVEHGIAMGESSEPNVLAVGNGDLATLRTLRRLGCPWGGMEVVFFQAVARATKGTLPMLRWLLEAGCPVNWNDEKEYLAEATDKVAVAALLAEFRPPPTMPGGRWPGRSRGRWPCWGKAWGRGRGRARTAPWRR